MSYSRAPHVTLGASSPERDARRVEAHRVFREGRATRVAALGTFSSDAKDAIVANPDYFIWWYTTKSLALCAAVAAVAYYVGKERGRSGA